MGGVPGRRSSRGPKSQEAGSRAHSSPALLVHSLFTQISSLGLQSAYKMVTAASTSPERSTLILIWAKRSSLVHSAMLMRALASLG